MGEDRPSNAREFIRERHDRHVAVRSLEQPLEPMAEWGLALGEPWQSGARPMDQECPQVGIAAFADAEQLRFPAGRRLARDQPQPRGKVTATGEGSGIADRCHKSRRREYPVPGILINRRVVSSARARSESSWSKSDIRRSMPRRAGGCFGGTNSQ
jgi:hypothetical protein